MLRRDDHESHAEKRIRSCRINSEILIRTVDPEVDERTPGFSDPVLLLSADILREIHLIKTVEQLVRVLCDAEIPDFLGFLDDIAVADIAFSTLAVLVGQNDLAGRAVIDECLISVGQTMVKKLQEDPLCPLVIVFIRRVDHAAPVK